MQFHLWLTFVAAAVVLLALPGPTTLAVVGCSATHGKRATAPLVTGVALGDATALFVSLAGLGTLLATSESWFSFAKWAGGLYLLALGAKMLLTSASAVKSVVAPPPTSSWRLLLSAYTVTALNPKGIVFFVAFLPQFISPTAPASPQLWTLGLTFVVLAAVNATLYVSFAGFARGALESPLAQRRFHLLGGLFLCGAGVWALMARRPAL